MSAICSGNIVLCDIPIVLRQEFKQLLSADCRGGNALGLQNVIRKLSLGVLHLHDLLLYGTFNDKLIHVYDLSLSYS